MITNNEKGVVPTDELSRIAQNQLFIEDWGFKESYRSSNPGKLIYDSEWCRVSLIWEGWDPSQGNSIHIRYGRLHAPNEKITMVCNGEEARCWHRIEHPLHFLDGKSPVAAAELNYSHVLITPFYDETMLQKYDRQQPDWLAAMHVSIWKHYRNRLFELFDRRRPELWQQYQQFLKELYDIKGRIPEVKPPMDKVC